MEDIRTEKEFNLGKKQTNIIADILNGVTIINATEKRPISRQTIIKKLGQYSYKDTIYNQGNTNIHRPTVIGDIIGKNSRKNNYIDGISDENDILKITRSATETCSNLKTPITFRLVYGATEQASLRSLSYPLPILSIIKEISNINNINPNLQIIFANNLSGNLNDLDENKTSAESNKIMSGINHIAKDMGLNNQIGFYYDNKNINYDNLKHLAREFANNTPSQLLQTLRGKGDSNDLEKTCLYAAAHYEIHDNPDTKLEYITGIKMPEKTNIIDIGGVQEKYYRAVRLLIAEIVETDINTAQIYTRHHVPPYYMARGGDIPLDKFDNINTLENIATAAKPDLIYLNNKVDLRKLQKEVYND